MKILKRTLALVTAISICSWGMPVSAEDIQVEPQVQKMILSSATGEQSGTCGGELRWWYDGNGTLTIAGNDTMSSNPWSNFRNEITTVVIDNSVTNIISSAFSGCTNLTSVSLPESLNSIGSDAFRNCSALASITIPQNVTYIGKDAFEGAGCTENIDGVHYIGRWAVGYD
ncbi:MAG TPA: hypothetical protein DCO72_07930, partial [Ruminococcus sp.]|nr:hypothetical protein [Ruminococcus sp.]